MQLRQSRNRSSLADVTLRYRPEERTHLTAVNLPITTERVACPDCGLMQVLPVIRGSQIAVCRRCDSTLVGPATGRVDAPLALAAAALVLLLAAMVWPLMTVSSLGAERESWLGTCVSALWDQGFMSLAALVAAFSVVLPCLYLALLVAVLFALRVGWRERLGPVFRWVQHLRPWMMIEEIGRAHV